MTADVGAAKEAEWQCTHDPKEPVTITIRERPIWLGEAGIQGQPQWPKPVIEAYKDSCKITAREFKGNADHYNIGDRQDGFDLPCHMQPGSTVMVKANGSVYPDFPASRYWGAGYPDALHI